MTSLFRPFKSVAAALLFCALLGPVGLLYATFWGGVWMILLGIVVVSCRFIFPIILLWLIVACGGGGQ